MTNQPVCERCEGGGLVVVGQFPGLPTEWHVCPDCHGEGEVAPLIPLLDDDPAKHPIPLMPTSPEQITLNRCDDPFHQPAPVESEGRWRNEWRLWICDNCGDLAEVEPGGVCEVCEEGTIQVVTVAPLTDLQAVLRERDGQKRSAEALGQRLRRATENAEQAEAERDQSRINMERCFESDRKKLARAETAEAQLAEARAEVERLREWVRKARVEAFDEQRKAILKDPARRANVEHETVALDWMRRAKAAERQLADTRRSPATEAQHAALWMAMRAIVSRCDHEKGEDHPRYAADAIEAISAIARAALNQTKPAPTEDGER